MSDERIRINSEKFSEQRYANRYESLEECRELVMRGTRFGGDLRAWKLRENKYRMSMKKKECCVRACECEEKGRDGERGRRTARMV